MNGTQAYQPITPGERKEAVESLAAALSEERGTLEDVIEPYLMQQGFVMRTPRGRDIDAACGQLKTAAARKSRAERDREAEAATTA